SRMEPKLHRGSWFWAPAVKVVTMTSSKERAEASKAPAISAVEISGRVTSTNDRQPLAPRSMAASISEEEVRRSRASTLLYTITMQKVAWPITMVQSENAIWLKPKNELNGMRVMMPDRASGAADAREMPGRREQ